MFEQTRALLQRFDEGEAEAGRDAGGDHAGKATATADIDHEFGAGGRCGEEESPDFERFGIVALDCVRSGHRGDPRVGGGVFEERVVAFEQREPAPGLFEAGKEGG